MENDALIPDWIREAKAAQNEKDAAIQAEANRALIASMTIQAGAENFWKQFQKELKVNTDSLELIGYRGSISILPNQHNANEQSCRVAVASKSLTPDLTHIDIHYNSGGNGLRCWPAFNKPFLLRFCLDRSGSVAVIPDNLIEEMNPTTAAEFIVKGLIRASRTQ